MSSKGTDVKPFWKQIHPNIWALIVVFTLFFAVRGFLESMPYTIDPASVRSRAYKFGLNACETREAPARRYSDEQLYQYCTCASKRWSDGLTAAEIKPMRTDPAFVTTPALDARLESATAACRAELMAPN